MNSRQALTIKLYSHPQLCKFTSYVVILAKSANINIKQYLLMSIFMRFDFISNIFLMIQVYLFCHWCKVKDQSYSVFHSVILASLPITLRGRLLWRPKLIFLQCIIIFSTLPFLLLVLLTFYHFVKQDTHVQLCELFHFDIFWYMYQNNIS